MSKQPLRGRSSECQALTRMLDAVRAGESRALVLRGEAGAGKTALLGYAIESASGFRVARAVGVEAEVELAFAALEQLCGPMLDRLGELPEPQRDALGTAFGLNSRGAPNLFLVGLAVLNLLSEVAREQPLLCVIDDAQWLDRASAQALAFVARRLVGESVALIFAVRETSEQLTGLPELAVAGLRDGDARALLDSALSSPLDDRVRDQIVAETGGNPLALLELPRELTPAELAGGFGLPDAMPLSGRIEESFRRRLEPLPHETQLLLLVAAAEPVGEPRLVWNAAQRLGIGLQAAGPAVADGLVEFGARVRFRHPLVRSAIYQAAPLRETQAAHRVLAEATDPDVDPDRRAWHRAHASSGRDQAIAEELERSASRAQARGGVAAAAAFLELAARMTSDAVHRAERTLAAAELKYLAGAPDAALELLNLAEAEPLDELPHARVDLLRARIAAASNRGSDAPPLLLAAARRLEPLDVRMARETYLELLSAAVFAGPLAREAGLLEAAKAARAAPPSSEAPRAPDLLLDGLAVLITDGYETGAPILKRAVSLFLEGRVSREEELRWLWLACQTAMDLWDDEAWDLLSVRFVELIRDDGALAMLGIALSCRVGILVYAGELAEAVSLMDEIEAVTAAAGSRLGPYAALALATYEGREAKAAELIEGTIDEMMQRGEGIALGCFQWARACLANSHGRYEAAMAAAEEAIDFPATLMYARWTQIELVEAAARSGSTDRATAALEQLSETTRASGTDWALGIEARSQAVVSEGNVAERLYLEAIERLGRTRIRVERARAHLLYGEWLHGEGRRQAARTELRTAHGMFTAMGVVALAERAAHGLLATGETARKRTVARSELTAQEVQIARLARDGLSNPEIGSRLFISPRTVEYHLRKVFAKLGISSRDELALVLSDIPQLL